MNSYAPAYERFGSQISAIHFIGPNKPWNSIPYRPSFAKFSTAESSELAYDYNSLLDRWFNVYDRHYRAQPITVDGSFELKTYTPVWEQESRDQHTANITASDPLPSGTTFSLDELKKVAIEGLHSLVSSSDDHRGEGNYINLPLHGRVDLMAPRRPQELVFVEETDVEDAPSKSENSVPLEIRVQQSGPSTPPRKPIGSSGSFGWQPLPTPDPNDLPAGPRPNIISLPSTPTPHAWFARSSLSPQAPQMSMLSLHPTQMSLPLVYPTQVFPALPGSPSPQSHRLPSSQPEQTAYSNPRQVSQLPISTPPQMPSMQPAQAMQDYFPPQQPTQMHPSAEKQEPVYTSSHAEEEERRPPSPPLLLWNPAIEPPPTSLPSSSAFPSNNYYPNAWDQSPTKAVDGTSQSPDTIQLFQPPRTPGIPKPLVREGHYRQVTGDGTSGAAPSPDPSKVKHIFTWEDKPRAQPGRVFPSLESPSPKPVQGLSPSLLPMSPAAQGLLSPLRGLPVDLVYVNRWDTVPGIQKYASRLRPPKAPIPLAPAFDENEWKKDTEHKAEVSSRDGDDEDSSDESAADESDKDEKARNSQRQSRRSSIVSASELITGKKKQYKTRGVQTVPKDMRSRAVQVNTFLVNPSILPKTKNTFAGDASQLPDLPMSTAMPSPIPSPIDEPERILQTPQPGSSSEQKLPMTGRSVSHTALQYTQSPMQVPRLGFPSIVSRQVSNDSSLPSPLSSGPPLSPAEGPAPPSPSRKGGRVWDPARGVELFKRGSEEVLARFLKMGSWESEASRPR